MNPGNFAELEKTALKLPKHGLQSFLSRLRGKKGFFREMSAKTRRLSQGTWTKAMKNKRVTIDDITFRDH